jgi:hypothetical protein
MTPVRFQGLEPPKTLCRASWENTTGTARLEAKIKVTPEFTSQLKEIRDALKGTITAIDEAFASGQYEKVDQLTGQAEQLQGISHKIVQETSVCRIPGRRGTRRWLVF